MAVANTFADKALRFSSILDEIYSREAITAIFEDNKAEFDGTQKVKYPLISMDGLSDYDRVNGYPSGAVEVEYQEHLLEFDRGKKFRIDVIDDDESGFDLYREAQTQFVRTKEIPEVDAVRITRIANNAGLVVDEDLDKTTALQAYDEAEQYLIDAEVKQEDMVLLVSAEYYKYLKQSDMISRDVTVTNNNGNINRMVERLDNGVQIIKVPKARFYDTIELLNTQAGSYAPISGESKELNFILLPKSVAKAFTKRRKPKVIRPDANQTADAYDIATRLHHDLIVLKNKKPAIYVSRKTTEIA